MSFQLMKSGDDYNVRRLALIAASEIPGAHRKVALAALKKIGSDPAFTVPYGKAKTTFSGNGDVLPMEKDEEFENAASSRFYVAPSLSRSVIPGASPLNKIVDGMRIPYGVCAIVGGTGVGKTPLAHHLASAGNVDYAVVRAGEPFVGYDVAHSIISRNIGDASIAASDVVVDSVKDLLSGGKALMKGGISREAMLELSAWSILGATLGCTYYVPINPSDEDEAVVRMMVSSAMSSSSMVLFADLNEWKYTSRTGEGLERSEGSFVFSRAAKGEVAKDLSDVTVVMNNNVDVADALSGLIERNRAWNA